jgi:hypothetical protein
MSDKIPILDSEACYIMDVVKEKVLADIPDYEIRDIVYDELFRFMRVAEVRSLIQTINQSLDKETDEVAKSFNIGYQSSLKDYLTSVGFPWLMEG